MSSRIKIEDGVKWLAGGFSSDHAQVCEYKGTIWRGNPPALARVPAGQKSSRSNAKYDELNDSLMFGIKYSKADWDKNGENVRFYDEETVLLMTKEEAIFLARHLLDAATSKTSM